MTCDIRNQRVGCVRGGAAASRGSARYVPVPRYAPEAPNRHAPDTHVASGPRTSGSRVMPNGVVVRR